MAPVALTIDAHGPRVVVWERLPGLCASKRLGSIRSWVHPQVGVVADPLGGWPGFRCLAWGNREGRVRNGPQNLR